MPGVIVKGATISEKTYADSFASLFSDILPQKSSSSKLPNRLNGPSSNAETYEPILWTYLINKNNKEEYATSLVNEVFSLVIGYSTGFQVWSILEHGDALEVFSLRCGPVSSFRELPIPREKKLDKFANKRPLAVYAGYTAVNGSKTSIKTLNYISLLSGEQAHSLTFTSSIRDIVVNSRIVVVTFNDRLAVFDNATLEHKFSITSCYPNVVNPVSVADVWLAYVDRSLTPRLQSGGGVTAEYKNSYASTIVKSASYGLNVGLNLLTQYTVGSSSNSSQLQQPSLSPVDRSESASPSSLSSSPHSYHIPSGVNGGGAPPSHVSAPHAGGSSNRTPSTTFHINHSRNNSSTNGCVPGMRVQYIIMGVVTVVDILRVPGPTESCKHVTVGTSDPNGTFEEIVAHFVAHLNEAVVALQLTNRAIMATAGEYGHVFNVFKIHSHPWSSSYCAVHHLYSLKRGETIAKINHISLSEDLRWVVASSSKGTTHLFAINPYGGQPTPRTHCSSKVVNKEDKFYCSAGLDDVRPAFTNLVATTAAHLSTSPSSPSFESHKLMSTNSGRCSSSLRAVLNGSIGHPWLPPYPQPTPLDPVAQIKLPMTSVPAACFPSGLNLNEIAVTNLFAAPCFNLDAFQLEFGAGLNSDFLSGPFDMNGLLSSPGSKSSDKADNSCAYTFSLYTFFGTLPGVLMETSVRVCRDLSNRDCVEISNSPTAQWQLARCPSWAEVKPKQEENSPKEKGLSFRGKTDNNLVYQSQMSHDSVKTMTDQSMYNSADHELGSTLDHWSGGTRQNSSGRSCQLETRTNEYNVWMSQVEMNTHASPHRRLWMGPQFTFKTIQGNKDGSSPNFLFEDKDTKEQQQQQGGAPSSTGDMAQMSESGLTCVALQNVPSFQTVDRFQLEQLRINSCISPLVKSRNVVTPPSQRRLLGPSSLTPSSSSGASPPDLSAVNSSVAGVLGGGSHKSNPVPIFNYSSSSKFGIKNRNKSDSGDSISSTGSTGSSYPFYIEVGSGDFERCRTMLNVNSMPMLGTTGSNEFSGNSVAPNSLAGRIHSKTLSRKGSATSVEDFASWGEDTNLDDALNSIDNEPLISEDFHDALDEMNLENGRKRGDKTLPSGNSVDLIAIGSDQKNSTALVNGAAAAAASNAVNGTKSSSKSKKNKNRSKNKAKKEAASQHACKDGNGTNAEDGLEDLLAEAMMENSSSPAGCHPLSKGPQSIVDVRPISSDDSSSLGDSPGKWTSQKDMAPGCDNFYPVSPPPPNRHPGTGKSRSCSGGRNSSSFNEFSPHQSEPFS